MAPGLFLPFDASKGLSKSSQETRKIGKRYFIFLARFLIERSQLFPGFRQPEPDFETGFDSEGFFVVVDREHRKQPFVEWDVGEPVANVIKLFTAVIYEFLQ